MRLNTTVFLTVLLLLAMSGAGAASAWFGHKVGRDSLETVRQPDVSPTRRFAANQGTEIQNELNILQEREILVRVYDHIHALENPSNTEATAESPTEEVSDTSDTSESSVDLAALNLPASSQDQGVTMEVVNAAQEDNSLLLTVNLKNEGNKAVRFLYSFLEVKDDQGRALSAITDGLPGELPANGRDYSGTVKIPTALLEGSDMLSLSLTDYPDQKLQLNLPEIKVLR